LTNLIVNRILLQNRILLKKCLSFFLNVAFHFQLTVFFTETLEFRLNKRALVNFGLECAVGLKRLTSVAYQHVPNIKITTYLSIGQALFDCLLAAATC